MVVDVECLKKHVAQYKLSKDTAGEYHKQLFTNHKELAKYYDAEDIDPTTITKSQKLIMYGMYELQYFFNLPNAYGDNQRWKAALSTFKDHYEELNMPLINFDKTKNAFIAAMAKHAGGVSTEQKKNWEALLDQAYADMKQWKWC